MARARKLSAYPQEFWLLFMKVEKDKKPVTITLQNNAAARNLRTELYTFRQVVRNTDREKLTDGEARVAASMDKISFKVEEERLIAHLNTTAEAAEILSDVMGESNVI